MIALLCLLLLGAAAAPAQTRPNDLERLAQIKQLSAEQRWEEILELVPAAHDADAELDLYRGLALARLKRWAEAEAALEAGQRKAPRDARFPLELAGVAYQRGGLASAKGHLRRALALDPENAYARDFLATIYFLEENLEAALRCWNRVNKPALADFRFEPEPRLRPELRERAVNFSLGGVWSRAEFLATRARLDNLGVFPRYRFQLAAQRDESFEAVVHAVERNAWGSGPVESLVSLLRGLPYQTIHPEFYNLNRSALNVVSLVRWDAQKRRVAASLAWPLAGDPARRAKIYFDGRNENWDISRTFLGSSGGFVGFNLQKLEGGAELRSIATGRFTWSSRLQFAHRRFRNLQGLSAGAAPFFAEGFSLSYAGSLEVALLRVPERRFVIDAVGSGQFGRFFASPSRSFEGMEGWLRADWLPRARGDDYEMQASLRAGRMFGEVPFDELFNVGLERDNALWLRAHIGTRDARKGDAPLGRQYVLLNWEIDKNIYENPFVTLKVGPFVDGGWIADNSNLFGSRKWLWDTGAQVKVRVLGSFTVSLVYGRDLRAGRNTFYTVVSR